MYNSVDTTGLESDIGGSWISKVHYVKNPFHQIEYAMSELGALQLLQIYREDSMRAIAFFKQDAGADLSQSIAEIYRNTDIEIDFSDQILEKIAKFVERLIAHPLV
ncbi:MULTISPECIES: hypothetical protein [unclassified Paenibacillus]|uniref:hypothetical protein n=1 Tax=unclassified Paenibacillus TaxID=185978 RepID=UPI0030F53668